MALAAQDIALIHGPPGREFDLKGRIFSSFKEAINDEIFLNMSKYIYLNFLVSESVFVENCVVLIIYKMES